MMTFTREEIELIGGQFRASGRYADISSMKLIWSANPYNRNTGTICHLGGTALTLAEQEQLKQYIREIHKSQNSTPLLEANPAPPSDSSPPTIGWEEKSRLWAQAAFGSELKALANLPAENINKPGSTFSITLLKIASIVNGGGRHGCG